MLEGIAHYELFEPLGSGALGTTFRARDTRTGVSVALKLIHPEVVSDPEVDLRLGRGARIASELHHPNIARVIEHGSDAGTVFIASELVEGESLRARLIREGPLSEAETCRIAIPITHALIAANAQRVVHRDLRPENILLGEGGHVAVCDFGLTQARDVTLPTSLRPWIADPAYAAPEATEGRARMHSDLYSLGVMMWEMLTGSPPQRDASTGTSSRAQRTNLTDFALLRRSARTLAPVVRRLLETLPLRRYQSADELLTDLLAVEHHESTVLAEAEEPRHALDQAPLAASRLSTIRRVPAAVFISMTMLGRRFALMSARPLVAGTQALAGGVRRGCRDVGKGLARAAQSVRTSRAAVGRHSTDATRAMRSARGRLAIPRTRKMVAATAVAVALAGAGGMVAVSAMVGGDDGGPAVALVRPPETASSTPRSARSAQPALAATSQEGDGAVEGAAITPVGSESEPGTEPRTPALGSRGAAFLTPQPAALGATATPSPPPAILPASPATWTPVPPTTRPTRVPSSTPQPTTTPLPPPPTPTPAQVTVSFVSDTSWTVYWNQSQSDPVGPARVVCFRRTPSPIPPDCPASALVWRAAVDDVWAAQLPPALWIWAPGVTSDSTGSDGANFYFTKCFQLSGSPIAGWLEVAIDEGADLFVNDVWVLWADSDLHFQAADINAFLKPGRNCITFSAYNEDPCDWPCTYEDNPAGLLVRGALTYRPN